MTLVVPNAGEEKMLDLVLAVNMTMRLFTNDVTSGLTDVQIEALTEASFTEATFTGYAAKALTGGSWTTTQATPSTGVYAQQTYTRTSTGATQNVRGYYITRTSDNALMWFEYFAGVIATTTNGDTIRITPTFTLDDDTEADVTARGMLAIQTLTSSSSGYTATGNSDFVHASFAADASRNYRVHLSSVWSLSAAAQWWIELSVDGTRVGRFGDTDSIAASTGNFVSSSFLWQPASGTYTLRVIVTEGGGASTFTFIAASDVPRQFWIEDVGPR